MGRAMSALFDVIGTADPAAVLFAGKYGAITAGRIRKTAMDVAAKLPADKPIFLHTASAALFVSGLLAAAARRATVFCPAHLQPEYLREIGAANGVVLTDEAVAGALRLELASETGRFDIVPGDIDLAFFTSGTTSAPKFVPKHIAQLDLEGRKLHRLWSVRAGHVYATVSHQHIYGMLFRIFWPVISGRVSEDRPAETWETLSGKLTPATTLVSSPAHLTRIPDGFDAGNPALIFSSGAPLPFDAAMAAREKFGSLPIEVLGSTETGGIAWRQQERSDALWTPFEEVGIEADADGGLVVVSAVAGDTPVATGDLVEKVGAQIRLKGRGDRIAKIDGNRVSLPRVEEALAALPLVETAAVVDLPQRKGALGAIVELNTDGRAALKDLGAFRLSRKLREMLVGRMEPRERPKHWLFAPVPLDRQGKRVQAVLRAKFVHHGDVELGILMAASVDGDCAELTLELDPQMVWFQGHFPNEPILPGIAQTHMAAMWAECLWGFRPFGANLFQVKFRRVMRPGSQIILRLARDIDRQRLGFGYEHDGIIASEGKIGGRP
jgi:3-hydroxymyristoyl/3-hydroxydecanoyl-(acyl carrier protein) dehydratase